MEDILRQVLGVGAETLEWHHTVLRSVIVYAAALMMVRIGEKRFMGKNTAFDVILGIILGSVVSRSVNNNDPIVPTMAAGFALVALHWLLAAISYRSDKLGDVFKGMTRQLVRDGEIDWDEMQKSHISRKDLMGQIRIEGNVEDLDTVKKAYLERNGQISVIKGSSEPKIVEVQVADGVQTVRIVMES